MNQNAKLIKARVCQWNKAAAVLQDGRNHDIQHADTARAMHCFTGAVLAALPMHPPLPWSGLVEQQKIFRKVRVLASGEWEENLKPETRDLRQGTGKNHPNFSIQNLKLLSIDLGKNWPKQNL